MTRPYDYRPITEAPSLKLPDDARAAVWLGVNVEFYQWDVPAMSLVQFTSEFRPDPINVAWRDYGARVGMFRLIDGLGDVGAPVTGMLNAAVCDEYPAAVEAATAAGWSWVAHGWDNSTLQTFMDRDAESAYIERVTNRIVDGTGVRPRGWLGPVLAQSPHSLELLAEHGYCYNLDWGCDDVPFDFDVGSDRLVSVPYSIEVNDIPAFVYQQQSPTDFADLIRRHVDQIVREGTATPRVLGVGVHPFLVGQPARFGAFCEVLGELVDRADVFVTTADDIADRYRRA